MKEKGINDIKGNKIKYNNYYSRPLEIANHEQRYRI